MKSAIFKLAALGIAASGFGAGAALAAEPDYVAIHMDPVEVNMPAKDVWAKIGGFCDIKKWIVAGREIPCEMTGSGDVGSVRKIGGAVIEVMTAKTETGYGYTQPAVEGKWYNLYHGFLEVVPLSKSKSKIMYTLMLDESDKADQAAKDADVAKRKTQFQAAVNNMKALAEAK
ncbi:MAG: hypothetical protein GC155_01585 [Alphaproteobacteria bacterium]|nr:hypothetical protein [Alphaproteobacteria bacterium]